MHSVPGATADDHEAHDASGGVPSPVEFGASTVRGRAQWVLGVAAIVAVVVIAMRGGEAREFVELLRRIRPGWVLAATMLQAATYACEALIWIPVLSRTGSPQPFGRMFRLSIGKVFVSQAVPSGGVSGDVIVVRALARYGVPLDASMTALVTSLFGFYAAFATCALAAALVFYMSRAISTPILAIALPFTLILVALPAVLAWLVWSGHASRRDRWKHVPGLARVLDTFGHARLDILRQRGLLLQSTGLQIATFLLDAGTLMVMLAALGHAAPVADVFAAFMLASAAEVVGPVPGGLGAFEGGCIVGLRAFGVSIEASLLATLLLRGFTFWIPMVPGFFIARWAVAPAPK